MKGFMYFVDGQLKQFYDWNWPSVSADQDQVSEKNYLSLV